MSKNWKFMRVLENANPNGMEKTDFNDDKWEQVSLPHTAKLEKYICNDMWQGICWYRKTFEIPSSYKNKKLILEFEGVMGTSEFWINGKKIMDHQGGYLPVVFDISDDVTFGKKNLIAVKLNNTDNPLTGPKPLKKLDFCFYGGLYRNAHLIVKDKVYISHPAIANKVAGGGVFVHTPQVSERESHVAVKTHVVSEIAQRAEVQVVQNLLYDGKLVQQLQSKPSALEGNSDKEWVQTFKVKNAKLWSPKHPHLYTLETKLFVDGFETEVETHKIGIREFKFVDNQLFINGEQTYLRGTNRHQEYPYIGYALSDNAQFRDAYKIKESGFDYVRLSHYPQSPAFMDACDELGIVVLDAILGWQYYLDDERFNEFCNESTRQLVRRDRNHPCVLAWEVSLNETNMPVSFTQKLHELTHEEFPGDKTYTAGWQPEAYDIFMQARQHRILHPVELPDKPYMVSEYGDWEYYSRNAGLNQHKLDKELRIEKSSRQLRSYGEARLLQQCENLQEAHNDNLALTQAFADCFWVMYDYNSGVHTEHCSSGVMDMNRLPKFATHFYKSQRDLAEDTVLHIASYWTPESPLDVKVYSNCDEVELFLNEKLIARQKPDNNNNTAHLKHPPFTFKISSFGSGKLEARGFVDEKQIASQIIVTPENPVALQIKIDESGRKPEAGVNDVVFAYIAAVDKYGTLVPDFSGSIKLKLMGDAQLMNVGDMVAEAGIATAVIKIGFNAGEILIDATASDKLKGNVLFYSYIKHE